MNKILGFGDQVWAIAEMAITLTKIFEIFSNFENTFSRYCINTKDSNLRFVHKYLITNSVLNVEGFGIDNKD